MSTDLPILPRRDQNNLFPLASIAMFGPDRNAVRPGVPPRAPGSSEVSPCQCQCRQCQQSVSQSVSTWHDTETAITNTIGQ